MPTSVPFFDRVKQSIPFLLCLLLILLGQTPHTFLLSVPFIFVFIFYFAIFNAALLNGFACFALGILTDLIMQTPFGLNTFLFVLLFFTANLNRLFLSALSFDKLWQVFALMMLPLFLVHFFLFTLCAATVISPAFLIGHYLILILAYPLVIQLCGRLDNWIGDQS